MAYFWHNTGKPDSCPDYEILWRNLRDNGVLTAGFGNEPNGKGRQVLLKYDRGDIVFAYANGYGLIGYGIAEGPGSVTLVDVARNGSNHRHEAKIDWKVTQELSGSISPATLLQRFGTVHPRQASQKLPDDQGAALRQFLDSDRGSN